MICGVLILEAISMGKDKDQAWIAARKKAYEELFGPPLPKRRESIPLPVFDKRCEPKCPRCGCRPQFVEMTARVRCQIDDGDGDHALLGKADHVGKRVGPIHFVCGCGNSWSTSSNPETSQITKGGSQMATRTLEQEQAELSLIEQLRDGLKAQCTHSGLLGIHPEYLYVDFDLIESCIKDIDRIALKKMLGEDASSLEIFACMVLLNCARISKTTPHKGMSASRKLN